MERRGVWCGVVGRYGEGWDGMLWGEVMLCGAVRSVVVPVVLGGVKRGGARWRGVRHSVRYVWIGEMKSEVNIKYGVS